MQANSLYWFAAEQQTNTLTRQKCAFSYEKFTVELVFFSESNNKGSKNG